MFLIKQMKGESYRNRPLVYSPPYRMYTLTGEIRQCVCTMVSYGYLIKTDNCNVIIYQNGPDREWNRVESNKNWSQSVE